MNEQEILQELNLIFAKELNKTDIQLSTDTTAADVPGWDSFTHMMIIDSVEKRFKLKFKLNEVMKFKNVGDMLHCIKAKL
jgi:acyl carrier protein